MYFYIIINDDNHTTEAKQILSSKVKALNDHCDQNTNHYLLVVALAFFLR